MAQTAVLDELIANAWPAEVSEQLQGWRLRWTRGLSRRANSVLATGTSGDLAALVAQAENFYRARGATPMFQLSTASAPPALGQHLEQHGYTATAETLVAQAPTTTVLDALDPRAGIDVAVADVPSDEWFTIYWSVSRPGGSPEQAELCRSVLLTPPLETVFATAYVNGQAVGAGQAVFEAGYAGVQCMASHPTQRRHGIGAAILHQLAHQARQQNVDQMYLAVMADNAPARALYDTAGFRTVHQYRYLVSSA